MTPPKPKPAASPRQRRGARGRTSGQSAQRRGRLLNVVSVRLGPTTMRADYNAQELLLRVGEAVIVETPRGPTLAAIEGHVQRRLVATEQLPRVLRRASDEDIKLAKEHGELEREAQRFALDRVRSRRLPMKLIRAQYMHDGSKIVFYFSAEGRVDFRDLVKDLAHRFRTRIEMHQIGVRDGARMMGGIGPCGRELCCSTFLEHFAPVSIRMAKDQGLTLNPKKVSGMCGRLMCCLVYEQQLYKRMRRKMPRPGARVFTAEGEGTVIGLDVINKRVTIALDDHNRRLFALDAISPVDPDASDDVLDLPTMPQVRAAAPPKDVDYLWDDMLDDDALLTDSAAQTAVTPKQAPSPARSADEPSPRKRRTRRKRADEVSPSTAAQGAASAPRALAASAPSPAQAQAGEPEAEAEQRKRKRRRPRSKRAGEASGVTDVASVASASGAPDAPKRAPAAEGEAGAGEQRKRRRRRRRKPGEGGGESGGGEGGGD